MSSLEMSCPYVYDDFNKLENDLIDEIQDASKEGARIPLCPRLILCSFSFSVQALIDTGSQITTISEYFYNCLLLHGKVMEFPVSNIQLFTAVGQKSTTIKSR